MPLKSWWNAALFYLLFLFASKYDPVIPGKEFFQSRGEFSKIKKYMKHVIEPVFSFKDARSTVCQWCKLFKSVYDGMRYEGTLKIGRAHV